MQRVLIAIFAIVWGCESVALAQAAPQAPPPLPWKMFELVPPPQPATPIVDERVALSDAWLKQLDATERKQLVDEVPFSIGFSLLAAGAWTGFAIYYRIEQDDVVGTFAMSAAAAANIVAAVAELRTSDLYETRAIDRWARIGNLAMLATAAAFGAGSRGCNRDCSFLLGAASATLAAQALTMAAFQVFLPPLYVSRRYAEYRRMPDSKRPQFALDFLRAQEARARYAQYGESAVLALAGLTCVALTGQLDRGSSKQIMAGIGVVAFLGAIAGLLRTGSTTPSEQLIAGEAPPQPKAF